MKKEPIICPICKEEFIPNKLNTTGVCPKKSCKSKNYRLKKKAEEESANLKLNVKDYSVEISEWSEIRDALNLLKEKSKDCTDIQHLFDELQILDRKKSDLDHMLECCEFEDSESALEYLKVLKSTLAERRIVKMKIETSKQVQKISGLNKVNYGCINQNNYNSKVLDNGRINSDFVITKDSFSVKENISMVDYSPEYEDLINNINSIPLTTKFKAKTIMFEEGNLDDLKKTLTRVEDKFPRFRISKNALYCYN